jgi:hypothetical protein
MDSFIFLALLLLFLTAFISFFDVYFSTIEKRTERMLEKVSESIRWRKSDVHVWFKGFDMSKKKSTFSMDPLKTLYSYNLADLYVLDDKLIVVGKNKIFGRTRILSPLIICSKPSDLRNKSLKYLTRHIATELVGEDLEIQFEDDEYSNKIELVVKKVGKELSERLKASANNRLGVMAADGTQHQQ